MPATVCLQGGAEFGPACAAMDREVLRGAGGGPVVVAPYAAGPGREAEVAGDNGARYLRELGASDVRVAPHPDGDAATAVAAVEAAAVLVLPGGSPGRLRRVLTTTPIGAAIRAMVERGGTVIGASAGAMLLCDWTLLPDAGWRLAGGLGVVAQALVLPHWRGDDGWLSRARAAAPPGTTLLGLPECAGVIVSGRQLRAVGATATTIWSADGERMLAVGASWERP